MIIHEAKVGDRKALFIIVGANAGKAMGAAGAANLARAIACRFARPITITILLQRTSSVFAGVMLMSETGNDGIHGLAFQGKASVRSLTWVAFFHVRCC
jgi:hypothetical protein